MAASHMDDVSTATLRWPKHGWGDPHALTHGALNKLIASIGGFARAHAVSVGRTKVLVVFDSQMQAHGYICIDGKQK